MMKKTKVAFLDRDGTINEEKGYIKEPSEIEIISGSAGAVEKLNKAGYLVFGISNQSGIARGYFSVDDVLKVNRRTIELVGEGGGEIIEIFFCPHHPEGSVPEYSMKCGCRKPGTNLITEASEKYGLEFTEKIVIGDKICDLELGKRIGAVTVLVATGYGASERKNLEEMQMAGPDLHAENLAQAVDLILGNSNSG
ncbi:MAG: HAD family hydrolase [Nitrospinota bacterium]|nr:HAD family hydrolase [Nitrospinota bacterium]